MLVSSRKIPVFAGEILIFSNLQRMTSSIHCTSPVPHVAQVAAAAALGAVVGEAAICAAAGYPNVEVTSKDLFIIYIIYVIYM